LLNPGSFKPLRFAPGEKKLRDRLLTLPVMMAIVISLVYRQIPGLSEILRVLESEGLLWVEPLVVSKQAISKRLRTLPAELFAQVFEQVMQMCKTPNYFPLNRSATFTAVVGEWRRLFY